MTKLDAAYPPGLFSEVAAAQYLSMSVTTLRGANLPAKRFGRRKLYLRETLDAWRTELPDHDSANSADSIEWGT